MKAQASEQTVYQILNLTKHQKGFYNTDNHLLLFRSNFFRVKMEMRVKVSTADSGVLEGNDGPVGQLLWAACVVEGVAHQGRLEE